MPAADAYRAALDAAALAPRTGRLRLEFTGPDRAKTLHNLTTNEVKRLEPGRGCEAFVTAPQGKTLALVSLLAEPDRILLRTEAASRAALMPHFQKYAMLDDVAWEEVTDATFELHLCGPRAEDVLAELAPERPPTPNLAHVATRVVGKDIRLVRESPLGLPGVTVLGRSEDEAAVRGALVAAGARFGLVELDAATSEALRIEAGTPASGRDVTPENLPQELARDALAISFVKGCYLGQETVARIDALGHVNRVLRGLVLDTTEPPPPGATLLADGKPVGSITTAALSPGLGTAVALGIVRNAQARAGTELRWHVDGGAEGVARVVDLPMDRGSTR